MTDTEHHIESMDAALARLEAQLETSSAETDSLGQSLQTVNAGAVAAEQTFTSLDRSLSGGLRSAMKNVIFEGESLSSVFQTLAESMVIKSFDQSVSPVTDALSGTLTSGLGDLIGGILPFAKGGVIANGRVHPFAKGGVVNSPTTFPMQGGTGLMGEAGPEAIMPLARGADGRLGVQGGGSAVNVTMNVTTQDASSFQKSRSQIAAGLSRALQAGQRNR
ncbi:MAG: phage tail tape measure protein [Pseudomonadota bacterium]